MLMKSIKNNTTSKPSYPAPPFPEQSQPIPGYEKNLNPKADHGETSYKGSGKLNGKTAIITGGDSGIGRAVAIAFAREGANIVISYLNEHDDAADTAEYVREAGKEVLLIAGDISDEHHCKNIIEMTVNKFGGFHVLVNNAAFQMERDSLQDISTEEWDKTFKVNIYPLFYLCKAAEKYLQPGSSVINTTSVNAYKAPAKLIPYSATKAAIQNFTVSVAQLWADKGIRVNCVAPGPIWTPLITSTMGAEHIKSFGETVPMKRPGQPAELAAAFVLLACNDSSYMTASTVQVTGGYPTI